MGIVGPCAALVCYLIAKKDPRASIVMIFVATCELYGGKPSKVLIPLAHVTEGHMLMHFYIQAS